MAILDWLKEAPLSAIYKERLTESIQQVSSLEEQVLSLNQENMELKTRLTECEDNRRALEKQIIEKETHNNSLNFDKKTGTWVNNESGEHFCPSCKSKNIISPMKTYDSGWECPIKECKTFQKKPEHTDSGAQFSTKGGCW